MRKIYVKGRPKKVRPPSPAIETQQEEWPRGEPLRASPSERGTLSTPPRIPSYRIQDAAIVRDGMQGNWSIPSRLAMQVLSVHHIYDAQRNVDTVTIRYDLNGDTLNSSVVVPYELLRASRGRGALEEVDSSLVVEQLANIVLSSLRRSVVSLILEGLSQSPDWLRLTGRGR